MPYLQDFRSLLAGIDLHWFIIISFTTGIIINRYIVWSRLRHIPGPRFASFSKVWMLRAALSGRIPEVLNDVCETYGPNDLICSDPDVIRRMSTAKLGYRRSKFYSSFAFNPDRDTMLSTTDEEIHTHLKTKTAAGVSFYFQIPTTRIAGTDTTATATRAMLLHITTSPTCYTAFQAAIDEGVKNGKISSPITDAEAKELPYLQAVIKEGLRMFPVIAGLLPKTVPEGGDIISGFEVPGGTDISLCLIAITHSKATFGPDADIFRPERWLEVDDNDKLREMNITADLVFGSGKWSCSGKKIAMMEMSKVLVEEIRYFLGKPHQAMEIIQCWSIHTI
ncbi:hypothetical protein SS1G_02049 [Sclerotinia sclerotiorum 1980 UF-70]|uniref:Cytochrome P450 monooxygenase n=1 Tax=Sclerotinia sclerotiorum (strain ATCC 18683 / 1980 / Ss-1) TaxID=665079 RepID=A7E9R9_SCLS1|nr:hypothetical protein SS1G_02049 [Sclerotinia sclerotiorum 1980 UF-70]EDN97121.1 hypothetical protein SS1G_02049 [Sclerotinia sclerotiorum 1980 UF-70]